MLANCVCNYTAVETHGLLITLAQEWSELRINSVFVHIRHTYNMAARYGNDVIHLRHCTPGVRSSSELLGVTDSGLDRGSWDTRIPLNVTTR